MILELITVLVRGAGILLSLGAGIRGYRNTTTDNTW